MDLWQRKSIFPFHCLFLKLENNIKRTSTFRLMLELVIFDMDGTVVRYPDGSFQSSYDAIGAAAGKSAEFKERAERYFPHPELEERWFLEDCESLRGISLEQVQSKIFPPPYTPGFRELCDYLCSKDILRGIVSSGVDLVANKIKEEMGLDFALANEVHITEGKFTGTGKICVPLWSKGKTVQKVIEERRINPKNVAYCGDNSNDINTWNYVGLPIGINLKKAELTQHVRYHFPDFYGALELLQQLFQTI